MISTYPPKVCGVADYTEDLVRQLLKQKIDVHVITYEGEYKERFVHGVLKGHVFIGYGCAKEINRLDPDIVHFQSATFLHRRMLHSFPVFTDKPIVTTIHDIPFSVRNIHFKPFIKILYKRSDAFIVHSDNARDILIRMYKISPEIIHKIPHGVDIDKYKPREIKSKSFNILFFGFIRPDKRVELLIEAFRYVADKLPGTTLTIAGDVQTSRRYRFGLSSESDYRKSLMKLIQKAELKDKVNFVGYVPDKEVPELLNDSGVVVFPYMTFQSGPMHKALASGCAIICVGSDIIEDGVNGIVCRQDTKKIAEAIIELYNNNLLRKKLKRNARKSAEKMSWSEIAKKTLEVYRDIISDD